MFFNNYFKWQYQIMMSESAKAQFEYDDFKEKYIPELDILDRKTNSKNIDFKN